MRPGHNAFIVFFAAVNFVMVLSYFGVWTLERKLEVGQFGRGPGFSYQYRSQFPENALVAADSSTRRTASNLVVYENNQPLGPPHSYHDSIRQVGGGRYSHWYDLIYFSTSDNTPPGTNGRTYSIRYPVQCPISVFLITLGLLAVSVFGLRKVMKRVVAPGLLVCFGLGVAIIPVEFFLRTEYSKLHVFGPFGALPEQLRPTVNAQGYRDVEHRVENPSGRVRILILGDSLTFGSGLADDQIYPKLLADLGGPCVEIITLAKNGWSTADQLAALRREGLIYKPEITVIGVVTNDAQPPLTEPSGQREEWAIFIRSPLELDIFRFLDYYLNRVGETSGVTYSYSKWEDDLFDPHKRYWEPWKRTVHELSGLLRGRAIPAYAFILTSPAYPGERQMHTQIRKYDLMTQVFLEAGFRTTNLWPAYRQEFGEKEGKALWALPNDAHPGPAMNKFFAREMWKVIMPEVRSLLGRTSCHGSQQT